MKGVPFFGNRCEQTLFGGEEFLDHPAEMLGDAFHLSYLVDNDETGILKRDRSKERFELYAIDTVFPYVVSGPETNMSEKRNAAVERDETKSNSRLPLSDLLGIKTGWGE